MEILLDRMVIAYDDEILTNEDAGAPLNAFIRELIVLKTRMIVTEKASGETAVGRITGWERQFKSVIFLLDDGERLTIDPRRFTFAYERGQGDEENS